MRKQVAFFLFVSMCAFVPIAGFNQPANAATSEKAVIGMPFTGKWGYNAPRSAPYNDVTSSHPSVHAIYGPGYQWAADLYAGAGTPVKLRVGDASGNVSFSWTVLANGTCGQRTQVNVFVDGAGVGSLYYEHLANAVKSGPIANGMTLGTVHNGSCNGGPHIHVEFKSVAGNYSCYYPYKVDNTNKSGGTPLARLGRSSATGGRQACVEVPDPDPSPTWVGPMGLRYESGDIPIVGDWDGNGKDEIGIARSGCGFHLRSNTGSTSTTKVVAYGLCLSGGDIPIVGDWDGNGKDEIGVARGGCEWHLRSNTASTFTTKVVKYGLCVSGGDIPVVGDWDGNRKDDIGVARSGCDWHLRSNTGSTFTTKVVPFGLCVKATMP